MRTKVSVEVVSRLQSNTNVIYRQLDCLIMPFVSEDTKVQPMNHAIDPPGGVYHWIRCRIKVILDSNMLDSRTSTRCTGNRHKEWS